MRRMGPKSLNMTAASSVVRAAPMTRSMSFACSAQVRVITVFPVLVSKIRLLLASVPLGARFTSPRLPPVRVDSVAFGNTQRTGTPAFRS